MAQTTATSPGTMADDDTIGSVVWGTPNNAKVEDNVATAVNDTDKEYSIKIVKGGTISGTEKSTGAALTVDSYVYRSYGGSNDLWGLDWTYEDINASNFGVVFSTYYSVDNISHYLKATNFGFTIPSTATISGILVEVKQQYNTTIDYALVDHIRITIYYTAAYTMTASVGAFILTGIAAILSRGYTIIASVGAFILTGIAVGLLRPIINMAVSVGEFTLTGINVGLNKGWAMAVTVGNFTLTGIDALFQRTINLVASVGQFILTGIDIAFRGIGSWKMHNQPKSSPISPTNQTKHFITPKNQTKS